MRKVGIVIMMALLLNGCASEIQLTDKESNKISQYAAYVLLKHDKKYEDAYLSDVTAQTLEDSQTFAPSAEDTQADSNANVEQQTAKTHANQAEGSENIQQATENTQNEDMASVLGISNCKIAYQGCEITNSYPSKEQLSDSNTNHYYAVKPSNQNNKLLVLKFAIINQTDQTITCDIASLNPNMSISINNNLDITILSTLVPNDLSAYYGDIVAGAKEEAVLVLEVSNYKSVEQITDITLQVDHAGVSKKIKLQ